MIFSQQEARPGRFTVFRRRKEKNGLVLVKTPASLESRVRGGSRWCK